MSTADVTKVLKQNPDLEIQHHNTVQKCVKLWNTQKSTQKCDKIVEILGCRFVRPVIVRWNSFHNSIKKVLELEDSLNDEFYDAIELHESYRLLEDDFEYLDEYASCTKFVVETLDYLQGEKYTYYGCLIPSLVSLKFKLENFLKKSELKYCKPILEGLIASLTTRFQSFFNIESEGKIAAVAAALHPRHKLTWLGSFSEDIKLKVIDLLNQAVDEVDVVYEEDSPVFEDDFFVYGDETSNDKLLDKISNKALKSYLQAKITLDIKVVKQHKLIEELFLKFNTALPSSAPVEREFSYALMLNAPKFNKLTDSNFEKRVLWVCNEQF